MKQGRNPCRLRSGADDRIEHELERPGLQQRRARSAENQQQTNGYAASFPRQKPAEQPGGYFKRALFVFFGCDFRITHRSGAPTRPSASLAVTAATVRG